MKPEGYIEWQAIEDDKEAAMAAAHELTQQQRDELLGWLVFACAEEVMRAIAHIKERES